MAYHPAKRPPPKAPELSDKELAALRDVAKQGIVEANVLQRLTKLGLVEEKSGTWATTQEGHITLMFASAR